MKKIGALHEFLLDLDLFAAEQMDSYVDDLTITPACRHSGTPGQIVVAEKDYTATFYIERYPHGKVSEDALIAQVSAWLMEHDADRLEPVNFDIRLQVNDTETADLEFGISFNEWVLAEENQAGTLIFENVAYSLIP